MSSVKCDVKRCSILLDCFFVLRFLSTSTQRLGKIFQSCPFQKGLNIWACKTKTSTRFCSWWACPFH